MAEIVKRLFEFLLPYIVEFIRKLIEDYLGTTPGSFRLQREFVEVMRKVGEQAKKENHKKADQLLKCVEASEKNLKRSMRLANQ